MFVTYGITIQKKPQSQITIKNITINTTISKTTHFTVYCNQKP